MSKIAELVERARAAQARQEAEKEARWAAVEARRAEMLAADRAELDAVLAGLDELVGVELDRVDFGGITVDGQEYLDYVVYIIRPHAWRGACSFWLKHRVHQRVGSNRWCMSAQARSYRAEYEIDFAGPDDWASPETARVLEALQYDYDVWVDERIAGAVAALQPGATLWNVDDAFTTLNQLAPERAEEWRALRDSWQAANDAAAEAMAACRRALELWRAEYEATVAHNRGVVETQQESLDSPVLYYELHALATGEDGEERVLTAYALGDRPDVQGYWPVYEAGRIAHYRYLRPYRISPPCRISVMDSPPDAPWQAVWYVDEAGVTFRCRIQDAEDARAALADKLMALPEQPAAPADLDSETARRIRAETLVGMERVELPF